MTGRRLVAELSSTRQRGVNRVLALLLATVVAASCSHDEPSENGARVLMALHAKPPLQAKVVAPRLAVEGTQFVRPDGTRFQWRGITAFRLAELIARGREAEATAFLDWAAAQKLTVLRVLVMAHHLFQLSPAEGRAALPKLLALAEARGLYVEVVALADTAEVLVDLEEHVRAVGDAAGQYGNTLVEIANEPVHPTQHPRVHDPVTLLGLARLVPEVIPVALGADGGDAHAAGDYSTVHLSRDTGRAGWAHVTAIADAAALIERWKKPVVSDEPIGAGAEFQPGRRDNDPARFRAAGLLTRLTGLGATFHYENGLHARIATGRELECLQAWNEAWTLLPESIEDIGAFHRGGAGVFRTSGSAGRELFVRKDETEAWGLLIGPGPDSELSISEGWQLTQTRSLPGVTVIRAKHAGTTQ